MGPMVQSSSSGPSPMEGIASTSERSETNITNITPSSLMSTLDQFLELATRDSSRPDYRDKNASEEKDDYDGVETALFLLQNLPPARAAGLAYLGQIMSRKVWRYMDRKDPSQQLATEESSLIKRIESFLCELLEDSPEIWAPLISRWAVDQLGRWSVEWEREILGRGDSTLEERVAAWLACAPANALASLTVSCIATDADNTMSALLDASIHSGPSLDWLVAHVGCSFPATIINSVLSLGLKSFSTAINQSHADQQISSINMILVHLAERHFSEIQRGLHNVLLKNFSGSKDQMVKASIPYLLKLANTNYSRSILNALTASLPQILEPLDHVTALSEQVSWWIPHYLPSVKHLIDLGVRILLDTEGSAACPLIYLLLKGSQAIEGKPLSSVPSTLLIPSQLLHTLITELCRVSYSRRANPVRPHIPFLSGLSMENEEQQQGCVSLNKMNINNLIQWTLFGSRESATRRLGQMLTFLVVQQGSEASSPILRKVLASDLSVNHCSLYLLNTIMSGIIKNQAVFNQPSKTLTSVLSYNLQSNMKSCEILQTVKKIEMMLASGRIHGSVTNEALTVAVQENVLSLSKLVNIPYLSVSVLELIDQLPLGRVLPISHLLSLGHVCVYFFYSNLREPNTKTKLKNSNLCCKALTKLAHSSLGHSLLVRLLFEASFHPQWAYLFGAKQAASLVSRECPDQLFKTNLEFDSWVKLPQSLNTIFHAGKIGNLKMGYSGKGDKRVPSSEEVTLNTQMLLNILGSCCRTQGASQGATTIALLLVEYIVPDIMFNGFPWPEENIKFTFERDLAIQKTFEEYPIAWSYLGLVAQCRPSLCYCSVLVRALTAALTVYWTTSPLSLASDNQPLVWSTQRLIELMVVGQFLPETFSVLPQVVSSVAPHDVVVLLQDVWAYLRDHTPSPDRWVLLPNGVHQRVWETTDSRYTDRCRNLIHVHIEMFGHLMPSVIGKQ